MFTKLFRVAGAVALLLTSGAALSAHAQTNSYDLTITQTLQTMDLSNRLFTMRGRSSGGARRSSSSGGNTRDTTARSSRAGTTKVAPAPTTTFRPVAESIFPQELAREMAKTPAERQSMEVMFKDLLADYKALVRQRKAPLNDVARAASYLVSSSLYVHQDARDISERDFVAVKDQMYRVFLEDEAFQRMSDRERQVLYENFAITGTFIGKSYNFWKQRGDTKALNEIRQMAREQFRNMVGADIDKIKITAFGIEQ